MGAVLCEFNSVNGENTGVYVRTGMGASYPSVGILIKKNCPKGQFYIDNADGSSANSFYRLLNPEKYKINASGKVYVKISSTYLKYPSPSSVGNAPIVSTNTTTETITSATSTSTIYNQALDDKIYEMLQKDSLLDKLKGDTRIFGLPFQFTNVADHRILDEERLDYGRKYLENIIAEAPIIYLSPGIPEYMPDADTKTKEQMDQFIKERNSGSSISDKVMADILGTDLRYYDFVPAYAEYIRYVNLLCRICSIYMGISELTVPGTTEKYGMYDWGRWSNIQYTSTDKSWASNTIDKIKDEIFGDYKFVKCYADPNASFNESNGNSSTASQVAGLFDSLEGIVKEVGFFSNGSGLMSGVLDTLTSGVASIANGANSALDADVSAGLSKIIGNATHVIQGSNVIFPELWGDSVYNKSYSFSVTLVSPYGDPESVYLNIIVPMMHLIALSMPRQTSANSFGSPFLVKAFAKGWFSCDLGMVDSISITKEPSSYNIYGLPNEVKIDISIKDLYTNLMISKSSAINLFFANQGLIEFLAVTSGVNITQGNIALKIESIISTFKSTLFDIPSNIYDNVIQGIRNIIEPWFKITR